MTGDRLPSRSGKPTFINKIGPLLLIILSSVIGIFAVELFCHLYLPATRDAQTLYEGLHRVILLGGRDTIFENHGDIFTYNPYNKIENLVVYSFDDGFEVEYDYHFLTNNFGLVQDADIIPEQESLLLLGDSFTEGQGAEPWFRLVAPVINKLGYQAVNGGLLGTGFEQWAKLARYLADKKVLIRKLVVLFITDDYYRPVRNAPDVFQCPSALPRCPVEGRYLFFRLPPPEELSLWITRIRTARAPMIKKFWLEARVEKLLPASYHIYKYFSNRLRNPTFIARLEGAEQQSRAAISEIISIYGSENVTFIHLPTKNETDGPTDLGLKVRRTIREAGGEMFDGFKLCRLTATDYYARDGHPTSGGYAKIASCVTNIITQVISR